MDADESHMILFSAVYSLIASLPNDWLIGLVRIANTSSGILGFLERALKQGRSIRAVQLEKSEKEDDDWLTFEFDEPDPAIHRFVNPLRKRTE